jgi:hypothetical protein
MTNCAIRSALKLSEMRCQVQLVVAEDALHRLLATVRA